MKTLVLFLLGISVVFSQASHMQKVLLKDPHALCLDGSPGAYYIQRGQVPTRIILFFEGGGWCGSKDLSSTLESCYQRSKGTLGSSKTYNETVSFTEGILSNSAKNDFREATKVFLKYCDGSGHQGTKSTPVSYKDAQLYFRGNNITVAQLNQVQKTEGLFTKATDIIVSGASAGGLAAYLWVDYIKERAKAKNVYAAPDSGIFLDSPHFTTKQHQYRNSFINLFKLSNTEIAPPVPDCVVAFPGQPYRCMFAQNLHKHIKTPIFAIQSLYDTWSVANILGISCINATNLEHCNADQMKYIEEYHKNTSTVLSSLGSHNSNGFWGIACAIHTFTGGSHFYSADYRIPMNSVNSIDTTLLNWIMEPTKSHKHMDASPWPSNKPCSGKPAINLQMDS